MTPMQVKLRQGQFKALVFVVGFIYCSVFLLHDVVFRLPAEGRQNATLTAAYPTIDSENPQPVNGVDLSSENDTHQCPFCNGFTGGPALLAFSLPAGSNRQHQLPPDETIRARTLRIPSVRAPPTA